MPLIEEEYLWNSFIYTICRVPGKLYDLIKEYFHEHVGSFFIFGAGEWGDRCCQACMEAGLPVEGFVDNDTAKWNTEIRGLRVMAPEQLKTMDAYVLVTIQKYEDAIKKQLKDMNRDTLRYVGLAELKELYESKLRMQG